MSWLYRKNPVVARNRIGKSPELVQRMACVVQRVQMKRIDRDRLVEARDRVGETPEP